MNKLFFAIVFIFTAANSLFGQSTFPIFRDSLLQSNRLLISGNFDATGTSMKKELTF